MTNYPRIMPAGDCVVVVEFSNEINEKIMDEIGVDLSTKMNKSVVPNNEIMNQNNGVHENNIDISTKNRYPLLQQGENMMSGGGIDNEDELLQQRLNSLKK